MHQPSNNLTKFPTAPQSSANFHKDSAKGDTFLNLPINRVQKQLIEYFTNYDTCIVLGETGCGKSTQIPKLLMDYRLNFNSITNNLIAITQPRRVAAVSLASRVAEELGNDKRDKVAYSIRFDTTRTERSLIIYVTDGVLLREAIHDPMLKNYSILIVDEAHERSIHTDILLGVAKNAQYQRSNRRDIGPLKIIIMSATMNANYFAQFFKDKKDKPAPILLVEGRTYPVDILYLPPNSDESDYIHKTIVTIFQLHRQLPTEEAFLVFLTGRDEIDAMKSKIRKVAESLDKMNDAQIDCRTLYATMNPEAQMHAFAQTPKNRRKIVLATNIAETSVTVLGIRHVIDCGRVKIKEYDPSRGIDVLKIVNVSKAQAIQRAGRAGREAAGTCYRLYTEKTYKTLPAMHKCEMERSSLTDVLLEILALGAANPLRFNFISKPPLESIQSALDELQLLKAIEPIHIVDDKSIEDREFRLTPTGKQLIELPVEPRLGRCILEAYKLGVLGDMLSLVAMLSADSVFVQSLNDDEVASKDAHCKYAHISGDHMTLLNVYNHFKQVSKSDGSSCSAKAEIQFCRKNFVSLKSLQQAKKIRTQLQDTFKSFHLQQKSCKYERNSPHHTEAIRKALCAGLFTRCAKIDQSTKSNGTYKIISSNNYHPNLIAKVHPSSVLYGNNASLLLFTSIVQTSQLYIRDVSVINSDWIKPYVSTSVANLL